MTVNRVTLIGNLGQDPKIRTTAGGTSVGNLRLATTDRRKSASGDWEPYTEWHNVVVFGSTAENVGRFCRKGKQIFVEGRIQTRKWQDKDGNDRYSTEIVANQVKFLGQRDSGDNASAPRSDDYGNGSGDNPF